MNTDYLKSHLVDDIRLTLGREMLSRIDGIRQDIAIIGVPAIISVIEALIASDEFLTREDVVRKVQALCRADMADTVEDLVDHFQGDDPRSHLWFEGPRGFYGPLPGPFTDFPN